MRKNLPNFYKGIPLGQERPQELSPPRDATPLQVHTWTVTSQSLANRDLQLRTAIALAEDAQQRREEAKNASLPDFCINHLQKRRAEGKNREGGTGWKAATLHRTAAALVGFFMNVHVFLRNATLDYPIRMADSTTFFNALVTMKRCSMETQPVGQDAATPEDVVKAMELAPTAELKFAIALLWCSLMRIGDLNNLLRGNVEMDLATGNVRIHVGKGKGVLVRQGKYEIHTTISEPNARKQFYDYLMSIKDRTAYVFPATPGHSLSSRTRTLNKILQQVRPTLTTRSFRRGSAQHLAAQGFSDEVLMALTGHKSKATLYRYLDWSLHNESQHTLTRAATATLALPDRQTA